MFLLACGHHHIQLEKKVKKEYGIMIDTRKY